MVKLTTEQLDKLLEAGMQIQRSVVEAGNFLYVPAGHLILERVIGDDIVLGVRTALVTPTDTADMFTFVKAYSRGAAPEPTLLKFWTTVLALTNTAEDMKEIEDPKPKTPPKTPEPKAQEQK